MVWRKSLFANAYDYTLGKLCFSTADQIVAISQANLPFIQKFCKTPIEVIYRGIDFPQLTKKKKKADQIFIGFVGRLVKLKGVALLISAFSELIKEIPELRLKIIGNGPEKDSLQKQVQELNLQDKVSFLGFQEQEKVQNELLPKFDLFVNPSFQEGLPTTVIEALLAETIVVATEV